MYQQNRLFLLLSFLLPLPSLSLSIHPAPTPPLGTFFVNAGDVDSWATEQQEKARQKATAFAEQAAADMMRDPRQMEAMMGVMGTDPSQMSPEQLLDQLRAVTADEEEGGTMNPLQKTIMKSMIDTTLQSDPGGALETNIRKSLKMSPDTPVDSDSILSVLKDKVPPPTQHTTAEGEDMPSGEEFVKQLKEAASRYARRPLFLLSALSLLSLHYLPVLLLYLLLW